MVEAALFITATLGVADAIVVDAYWLGRATEDGSPQKCPLLVRFRSARAKREVQRKCREVRPKGVYVDDDLSAEERAVRVKQRRAKKTAENTSPSDGPSTRHPPVPHRPLALLPARHLHGHRRLPQVRRTDRHHPPRPRVRHTDRRRDRPRLVTRIRPAAYLS